MKVIFDDGCEVDFPRVVSVDVRSTPIYAAGKTYAVGLKTEILIISAVDVEPVPDAPPIDTPHEIANPTGL